MGWDLRGLRGCTHPADPPAERNIPFEVSGGRIDLSTTLGTETSTDSQELLAGDEALEQEDDELLFAVGCGDMDDLVPTDTEESLDS